MKGETSMLTRRHALGAGAALLAARDAAAQTEWRPTREVEFVIPFAVGGGADLLARIVHKIIVDERLVPVAVNPVNRPGGGGAVGIGYIAAQRRADPHTLVLMNSTVQITPIMTPTARGLSEVRPLMNLMVDDFVLFVKGDAPWRSAREFVDHAKTRPPRSIAFALGGTTDSMAVTVFGRGAGAEFNQISFNSGGEALTALLGGQAQFVGNNLGDMMGAIQQGTVRALAISSEARLALLPNVPTAAEAGLPQLSVLAGWNAIAAPAQMPEAMARYWEGVIARTGADAEWLAATRRVGSLPRVTDGAAARAHVIAQIALFRGLAQRLNLG
jgi:putative tricarboxylic transport membrane protein